MKIWKEVIGVVKGELGNEKKVKVIMNVLKEER